MLKRTMYIDRIGGRQPLKACAVGWSTIMNDLCDKSKW